MEKQSSIVEENSVSAPEVPVQDQQGGGVGDVAMETEWTVRQASKKSKRRRRSTGGTFADASHTTLPESEFVKMDTDNKLLALFRMMATSNQLNSRVEKVETEVQSLSGDNKAMNKRLRTLEYRSIDAEARSRGNNLVFRGISEVYLVEDCESLVRQFLRRELDLDTSDIYIQRAHRLGKPKAGKSRPIIVCFRDYPVVENILQNAHKLKNKPTLGINRDYPKEIIEARSRIWPEYKTAKSQNPHPKTVFIAFPAKLVVNKRVVRDEFPDWKEVLEGSRHTKDVANASSAANRAQEGLSRGPPLGTPPVAPTQNSYGPLAELSESSDSEHETDSYSQSMRNLAADINANQRYVSSQEVRLLNNTAEDAVDLSASGNG